MLIFNHWQSRIAILTALGMTSTAVVPIMLSAPAIAGSQPAVVGQLAQSRRRSSALVVPAGTTIPVRYQKAEKIVVTPDETTSVTLIVASNIRSERGNVVIPAGSQIKGELRPASEGTRFVAEEVIFANSKQSLPIEATSSVVTRTETVTKGSNPDFLRGAAIGAGASAVLSDIFGDIDLGEVLVGAGIGAAAEALLNRGRRDVEVVVVYPERDLDLRLQEDFVRSRTSS